MLDHRDDAAIAPFFKLACGPHPEEELYDLSSDPDQLLNVAADPKYAERLESLRSELVIRLR